MGNPVIGHVKRDGYTIGSSNVKISLLLYRTEKITRTQLPAPHQQAPRGAELLTRKNRVAGRCRRRAPCGRQGGSFLNLAASGSNKLGRRSFVDTRKSKLLGLELTDLGCRRRH